MRCDECSTSTKDVVHTHEQVHWLQARIAELEEALRPFASQCKMIDDELRNDQWYGHHLVEDYERARKVLSTDSGEVVNKLVVDTNEPTEKMVARIDEAMERIGKMCSEGRPPHMSIPVRQDDDDVFICDTLRECRAALTARKEG